MNKVKSPKLLMLYAKAKMSENKFKEAEEKGLTGLNY